MSVNCEKSVWWVEDVFHRLHGPNENVSYYNLICNEAISVSLRDRDMYKRFSGVEINI